MHDAPAAYGPAAPNFPKGAVHAQYIVLMTPKARPWTSKMGALGVENAALGVQDGGARV